MAGPCWGSWGCTHPDAPAKSQSTEAAPDTQDRSGHSAWAWPGKPVSRAEQNKTSTRVSEILLLTNYVKQLQLTSLKQSKVNFLKALLKIWENDQSLELFFLTTIKCKA